MGTMFHTEINKQTLKTIFQYNRVRVRNFFHFVLEVGILQPTSRSEMSPGLFSVGIFDLLILNPFSSNDLHLTVWEVSL